MARLLRPALVLFLLTTVVLPCIAADSWYQIQSPHVTVLHFANERRAREVAARFEQMVQLFGGTWQRKSVSVPVPLHVVAFRSRAEMDPYAPRVNGMVVASPAFFEAGADRNYIGFNLAAENPWPTVFHQFAHVLLHGNFPPAPAWFDEGLAEYYSTLQIGKNDEQVGELAPDLVHVLSATSWMKISDLFAAPAAPEDRKSIFYAESALVVNYVLAKQQIAQIAKYLQLTQLQNESVPHAINDAFGMDAAQLEAHLREFLGSHPAPTRSPLPYIDPYSFPGRKVDSTSAMALLADIHGHNPEYRDQAMAELQGLMKDDPQNVDANDSLAYACLEKQDFPCAAEHIERIMAKDPKDGRAQYLAALDITRKSKAENRPPKNVFFLKGTAQGAVDLNPERADAYHLLAYALFLTDDAKRAIASELRAVQLNPSNENYPLALAQYYIEGGRFDDADAVIERLRHSRDPKIVTQADQQFAALQTAKSGSVNKKTTTEAEKFRRYSDPTSEKWRVDQSAPAASDHTESEGSEHKTDALDKRPTKYLHATLISVACSPSSAVLTLNSAGKRLRMSADPKGVVVIGEDTFSCYWSDRKVLVNYKPGGKFDGDVVTLELQ